MRASGVFRALVAAVIVVTALVAAAPSQAGMVLAPAYQDSALDDVDAPVYLTAPLGDSSRMFVVERGGRIRLVLNGVVRDTPFLDIHTLVSTTGEGGLLSMAVAPDYATSGKFYVYFVEPPDAPGPNGDIRIEEYQRDAANPNVADLSTRRLILEIAHDAHQNHYGGQLQFGPDGKLYAGTGDGGGSNNQDGNARNPVSNLGKLLAIDPAGPTVTQAGIGLRNPFRFSFDRTTGDLIIGDVGQDRWEEVDWVPAPTLTGLDFGWSCFEGNEAKDPCAPASFTFPVLTYQNPPGSSPLIAVTGGVVVRDPALTTLAGRYLYADFYAGRVRSAALASPSVTDDRQEDQLPKVPNLAAFGEDADGHVYVVSLAGAVYRITCETTCDPPTTGGGGGGNPPPGPGPAPEQPPAPPADPGTKAPPATPAVADSTAPRLALRARRVQNVARLGRLRLSALCSEACSIRVTARASSGLRRSLAARTRSTIELRSRLRRATRVTITVRATDSAGNAAVSRLVVRLRR